MRHITLFPLLAGLSLILVSCTTQKSTYLSPKEVLARSIQANAQTESVQVYIDCEYEISGTTHEKGTIVLAGNTASRFQSFSGSGSIRRHLQKPTEANSVYAVFDIAALSSRQWYMRFRQVLLEPAAVFNIPPVDPLQWWAMSDIQATGIQSVSIQTPDPVIINNILGAVIIDKDDGQIEIDHHKMYHYHIHIDADSVDVSAAGLSSLPTGEIWIDAQTFLLRRAIWNIRDLPGKNGRTNANIDIRLSRHNEQLPINAPRTSDYPTADVWRMFHTILPSALLPE